MFSSDFPQASFPSHPDINFTRDRQLGAQFSYWTCRRLTWKSVGFGPQNHSGHHADAADIEDPEAREEITNSQVAYVRCCLRLGLQYHQFTCFPPVKLYIFLPCDLAGTQSFTGTPCKLTLPFTLAFVSVISAFSSVVSATAPAPLVTRAG